jgi:hypothetical protein
VGDPDVENGKRGAEKKKRRRRKSGSLGVHAQSSEAKPSMQDGWVPVVVRGCLEGMGEFPGDQASLDSWLEADVWSSPSSVTIN